MLSIFPTSREHRNIEHEYEDDEDEDDAVFTCPSGCYWKRRCIAGLSQVKCADECEDDGKGGGILMYFDVMMMMVKNCGDVDVGDWR